MKNRDRGWMFLVVAVIAFFLGRLSAEIPRPDVPQRPMGQNDYLRPQ